MGTLIQTRVFSCNIVQFRARMQRLDNRLGARGWTSSNGVRLVFGEFPYTKWVYESIESNRFAPMGMYRWIDNPEDMPQNLDHIKRPHTRASWAIVPWTSTSMRPEYHPQKGFYFACLEVYEESKNRVRVDFLDAYNPEFPKREFLPIGAPFVEFTMMLLDELWDLNEEGFAPDVKIEPSKQKDIVTELLEILDERFNEQELKTFCVYLKIDYDNLPAEGKINKARELIQFYVRRNQIGELINGGMKHRTDINWPSN